MKYKYIDSEGKLHVVEGEGEIAAAKEMMKKNSIVKKKLKEDRK